MPAKRDSHVRLGRERDARTCNEKSNDRLIIIIRRFGCVRTRFSPEKKLLARERSCIIHIDKLGNSVGGRPLAGRGHTILRRKLGRKFPYCTARLFKFYWSRPARLEEEEEEEERREI